MSATPIYLSNYDCVVGSQKIALGDLYPNHPVAGGFESAMEYVGPKPNGVLAMIEILLKKIPEGIVDQIDRVVFTSTKLESMGLAGHFELQKLISQFGLPIPALPVFGYGCAGMLAVLDHHLHPNENLLWLSADTVHFSDMRLLEKDALMTDAAGCCVFSEASSNLAVRDVIFVQDGTFHQVDREHSQWNKTYFFRMASLARSILRRNGLSITDIAHIIPHFTNRNAWSAFQSVLKFEDKQLLSEPLGQIGHLYGVDTVFGLRWLKEHNNLSKGDWILTLNVGVGASFGAALIEVM